jgi:hypothetical protein
MGMNRGSKCGGKYFLLCLDPEEGTNREEINS